MDKVIVLDNCISKYYQDWIENTMTGSKFPWYFGEATSTKDDPNTGFSHIAYSDNGVSNYHDMLLPIVFESIRNVGFDIKELYRIRAGLFTKGQNDGVHERHIDLPYEHHVMLYYVIDSDGPTYIWGDKEYKIDPKKGRCVFFPGNLFHASSTPKDNPKRIVINYNFKI